MQELYIFLTRNKEGNIIRTKEVFTRLSQKNQDAPIL